MSDSMRRPVSKLSFITTMLMKLRSVPAPAPIAPPMKSIASFSSLADLPPSPCVSSDAASCARPSLPLRIERAAGAHDHPHADDRLLVMEHDHDLQAVGQRLQLVGRKGHVPRGQRPRRSFGRPARLRRGSRRRRARARAHSTHVSRKQRPPGVRSSASPPPLSFPDGISVSTSRFSGVKYVRATRCTSAAVMFWKMSNSPSAVVMSS